MNLSEYKRRILSAVPIDAYIGRYVALKKQGKYLKGLCPFHQEKSPSFTVTPEKGIYHCFGCGVGGDVIHFVMEYEGVPFPEALDLLAGYAGIEKPQFSGNARHDSLEPLYRLNDEVMRLYRQNLSTHPAGAQYAKERNLSPPLIETFQLGFAPDLWQFLSERLKEHLSRLKELGLVREGKSGPYDFFRNRLIFPIQDVTGRVIAFGGRALPGEEAGAKYINSSESPLFHKGTTLYALHQALPAIRSKREVYLVEGYLDVIGLYGAGIQNVVAPLGTAVTADHLRLIQRYTDQITFILDGDRAGRAAALKATKLLLNHGGGLNGSVIILPEGLDPNDLAGRFDRPVLHETLQNRIPCMKFMLIELLFPDRIPAMVDEKDPVPYSGKIRGLYEKLPTETLAPDTDQKRGAVERFLAFLPEVVRPVDQEILFDEAARLLGIRPAALRDEWERNTRSQRNRPELSQRGEAAIAPGVAEQKRLNPWLKKLGELERRLLIEFLYSVPLTGRQIAAMTQFQFYDQNAEVLWRYLENRYLAGDAWDANSLIQFDLPETTVAVFSGEMMDYGEFVAEAGAAARDGMVEQLLRRHRMFELKKNLEQLHNQVYIADSVMEDSLYESYAKQIQELKELEQKEMEDHAKE